MTGLTEVTDKAGNSFELQVSNFELGRAGSNGLTTEDTEGTEKPGTERE